jgi:hypothetical protein
MASSDDHDDMCVMAGKENQLLFDARQTRLQTVGSRMKAVKESTGIDAGVIIDWIIKAYMYFDKPQSLKEVTSLVAARSRWMIYEDADDTVEMDTISVMYHLHPVADLAWTSRYMLLVHKTDGLPTRMYIVLTNGCKPETFGNPQCVEQRLVSDGYRYSSPMHVESTKDVLMHQYPKETSHYFGHLDRLPIDRAEAVLFVVGLLTIYQGNPWFKSAPWLDATSIVGHRRPHERTRSIAGFAVDGCFAMDP